MQQLKFFSQKYIKNGNKVRADKHEENLYIIEIFKHLLLRYTNLPKR